MDSQFGKKKLEKSYMGNRDGYTNTKRNTMNNNKY